MYNYDAKHRNDLEQIILGTCFIDKQIVVELVRHGFRYSDFHNKMHADIFKAIVQTHERGLGVDLVSVYNNRPQRFRNNSANDFEVTMINMMQRVSSSAHFEHHCALLKQYLIADFWNKTAEKIDKYNWENRDVFLVSDNIINGYEKLFRRLKSGFEEGKDTTEDEIEQLKQAVANQLSGIVTGVPTGISEFDDWCGGFQPREYITIAARPGMGKTTFVLALILFCMKHNVPVTFFTLEMSKLDIKQRLTTHLTGIPFKKIKTGKLSTDEMYKVIDCYKRIDKSSVKIFADKQYVTFENTVDKIREIHEETKQRLVIIDYIQLFKLRKRIDKRLEVAEFTSTLKSLTNELNIPIVGLAQLSRSVETRGGSKIPKLSDLKESSSFEEDSDTVGFLYREAYYKTSEQPGLVLTEQELYDTQFIIAKGRNTGVGTFRIALDLMNIQVSSYVDRFSV